MVRDGRLRRVLNKVVIMSKLPRPVKLEVEALTFELAGKHLPNGVKPLVRWNYSRAAMGTAFYSLLCYRDPRITYSRPLLARTSREDQIETVYHEISHLIVFYEIAARYPMDGSRGSLWDDGLRVEGDHGPLFRETMARFGYANPGGC